MTSTDKCFLCGQSLGHGCIWQNFHFFCSNFCAEVYHQPKIFVTNNTDVSVEPTEGLRYNKGKVDLTQLSPLTQTLESLVYMFGECKYDRNNFKKFKGTEEEAVREFLACAERHLMKYKQGIFLDKESLMPHLTHVVWNLNRILDVHYYGLTHGKDGKDLYHQEYRYELPTVPTKDNFEEVWGIPYQAHKNKEKK